MDTHAVVQTQRPGLLVAMVVLRVVSELFGLLTAVLLLASGKPDGLVIGSVLTTIAVLLLFLAIGLWMLRRWARLLVLASMVVMLPLGLVGIVMSGGRDPSTYLGLVTDIFTIYVLFQPHIKRRFS